ncbi:MAG: glycosyltransferase family protein [Chloroflexota bacterium]
MSQPRVVAIVQARMGSSRLPGKVLADIAEEPMLVRVVERTRRAKTVHEVVVATTTDKADQPIAELCDRRGYRWTRGHPTDVLDRYYQAAREFSADVIVRLTADCPLIDPALIDEVVQAFLSTDPPVDFAANRIPGDRTYPIGLDTEVCSFQALETAWRNADQPYQREHVMPYLYEVPGRFRVLHLRHEPDLGSLRWAVDTAQDLELIRQVFARFNGRDDFTWQEVLALIAHEPELTQINADVRHKTYTDVDERLSSGTLSETPSAGGRS